MMKCRTPGIPFADLPSNVSFSAESPLKLDFGFEMDKVSKFTSMTSVASENGQSFPHFLMYPDPHYSQFEEENSVKYYKSDYLTINVSIYM